MPIDDRTTNRNYQLPNAGNQLSDDVARLRAALQAIDADVFARYTKTEVDTLINNLINGAPGALDTLNELAAAMGDDPNFAATVANSLASINTQLANRYTKAESDARYVQGAVQTEMVFTAGLNQTAYTLTTGVINKASALVTVDGVVQPTSEYSLSMDGLTLTLSEAPAQGATVRVLALGVASAGAPADDTVTTAKLRDGVLAASSAGLAKMADGFFSATAAALAKFADGFLSATTAGRAKMADGYITPAKLSAGMVLKVQHFTDVGTNTNATGFTNANASNFSYTPVSSNSTLIMLATFNSINDFVSNQNYTSRHRIAGPSIAYSEPYAHVVVGSGGGSGSEMAAIHAVASNTSTSARTIYMEHETANLVGARVYTANIEFTVIEVAN